MMMHAAYSPGGHRRSAVAVRPAVAMAIAGCKRYVAASGPPPPLSASQKAKLVAFAKCMRAHGVPQFTDHGASACGGLRKR
jgi:hypothetical protein